MATDALYLQSEKVKDKLEEWVGRWNVLANIIPKRNVEQISERDFRIPFETQLTGRPGTYNPDFGEIGAGNGAKGGVMISTYYPLRIAGQLSQLETVATDSKEKAIASRFKRALTSLVSEFANFRSFVFLGDGTAILGRATAQATVSGKTVYTMDTTTGMRRLRRGWLPNVYDAAMTASKASNLFIEYIDFRTNKVRLSGTVAGAAADDVLCFEGVSGASPVGPKGLHAFHSTATTGTFLGIDRANEPEIIPNFRTGSGGLNQLLALRLRHDIKMRAGDAAAKNLLGIASPATEAIAISQVMSVQRIDVQGERAAYKDMLPLVNESFMYGGVKNLSVTQQDQTRINWMSPDNWGVARLDGVKWFEIGGQRFFPLYGTNSPKAGQWFAMTCMEDYFNMSPMKEGFIHSIPVDTLYQ